MDVTPPVPIYKPSPAYPWSAVISGIQGVVRLHVVIDTEGNVADAEIVEPLEPRFDQIALETVRTWKFEPAKGNGVPVSVKVMVEAEFRRCI